MGSSQYESPHQARAFCGDSYHKWCQIVPNKASIRWWYKLTSLTTQQMSTRTIIRWQKLSETDIRSKYTDKLESYMSDYILKNCMFTTEISTHSKNEIDKCINDIKNMMCLASKLLPRQKPKGHARPYWCPVWSCIRVKTVRKSFESNSRSDLMTYVLIDAFVMLALLLISS